MTTIRRPAPPKTPTTTPSAGTSRPAAASAPPTTAPATKGWAATGANRSTPPAPREALLSVTKGATASTPASAADQWLTTAYGSPEVLNQATAQRALGDVNAALAQPNARGGGAFTTRLLSLRTQLEAGASMSDPGAELQQLAAKADAGGAGPSDPQKWLESTYGSPEKLTPAQSAAAAKDLAALFEGGTRRADNNPAFYAAALELKNLLERQAED